MFSVRGWCAHCYIANAACFSVGVRLVVCNHPGNASPAPDLAAAAVVSTSVCTIVSLLSVTARFSVSSDLWSQTCAVNWRTDCLLIDELDVLTASQVSSRIVHVKYT